MRRSITHYRRLASLWAALGVCLLAAPSLAATNCYGPYDLTSTNYSPSTAGDDVRDWPGDFTINLVVTTGPLTLNVESKLEGGDFASLGTMNATAIAQFHGPLHRLRYLVTGCGTCSGGDDDGATCNGSNCAGGTCGACIGSIIACAAKGE